MNITLEQMPDGWTRWPNHNNDQCYSMAHLAVSEIAKLRDVLEIIANSSTDSYARSMARNALGGNNGI